MSWSFSTVVCRLSKCARALFNSAIMKFLALFLLPALASAQLFGFDMDAVIRGVFDSMDYNLNGTLVRNEINQFFMAYDVGDKGYITEDEYIVAINENYGDTAELKNLYHGLFTVLDTNKNGRIEHSDIDNIFNRCDTNEDQKVTYNEFHDYFFRVATLLFLQGLGK